MSRKSILCLFAILISNFILAQSNQTISLAYDTSGYASSKNNKASRLNGSAMDTVPSIKAEMNVNDAGSLSYMVPIEVFKGVNNFQPNVALSYNSQSGNGQAGWGWNIVGLSMITQGGKSKIIDGITIGPQFDGNDPFYLDGQRLLGISQTNFETEHFSKIKITRNISPNPEYSFVVQYTDGKIAKYKELLPGQNYISVLKDALDNEVHYSYTIINNVTYLSSISYGGTSVNTDKFKISFTFIDRTTPIKSFRNGVEYKNTKVLSEILVSSTYLTANNGLYRKYKLYYDKIQSNTVERLIKIEVQNETGQNLKPLQFGYNIANAGVIQYYDFANSGLPSNTTGLGSVAVGSFYGGTPTPVYEAKQSNNTYQLFNPKTGGIIESYTTSKSYFAGKALFNNKITENDQLISSSVEHIGDIIAPDLLIDKLSFTLKDLVSYNSKVIFLNFKGGTLETAPEYDPYTGEEVSHSTIYRDTEDRKIISGDFNNDGLVDVLIIEKGNLNRPQNIYFAEIGLLPGGNITPILINNSGLNVDSDIYQVEFNGDGIPELLLVDKVNTNYSVYALNLANHTLNLVPNQQNIALANFSTKTPLIFGDYNGDGLTDFLTPQKIYSLDGSSSAQELQKMESEPLLWWEYLATGTGYIVNQRDYTQQKLAYIASSQRNVIKKSSFWQKFWAGIPNSYEYTEYGTSTILASDVNSDGKTDLISFRKFGKAKYSTTDKLALATIQNQNDFSGYISSTANKIFFHLSKTQTDGTVKLTNLPTEIAMANTTISPLSLVLNYSDYNQLNTFKSGVFVHDPITRKDVTFKISNDDFFEGQLRTVDNGSPVLQKIEYRPMVVKTIYDDDYNTETTYSYENLNLNYPFYVHKYISSNYLVYKLHTLFDDKILTKEYRYKNAIQHLDGKGFIGFQKTFSSDAYESVLENGKYRMKDLFKGVFWKINTYDPLFDNALSSTTYGSLNPNSVFSKTVITNQRFNKGSNRYLILSTVEQSTDYLKNITITKSYQYDTAGDFLLQQANTNYSSQGSSISKYFYKPEFNNGDHYFYGKIESTENIALKDGDTFSTKEEQTYNSNGTVLQTKKYGNGTPAIVTDYTYHPFGEVQSETLSTTGLASSLTTSYQYDTTNRFLYKVTTPDLLESVTNTNALGRVISEVSGLGLTTSYKYDGWGNVKEITDFLGKKTTISRNIDSTEPNGFYSISKKRQGGVETIVTFDIFDRDIKSKTQSLNGQWVVIKTDYDVFGKITRKSEPYFEGEAIMWNTVEYDDINRPIKQTSFNGKVVTTCYEGLKVTVEDGIKKTSKWLDAMGNTIRHKDSGGDIYYKYYPNGSLKETNYEGIKTTIEIDGWGNKTKLKDPSAGTYIYEYDNLSRIKKETNPKGGITEYTYDSLGRPLTENTTSAPENTIIVKNFGYDSATKLPTTISGTYNGNSYTYTTFYNDPFYRITGKKEETPNFIYENTTTYDSFGRADISQLKTTLTNPNFTTISNVKNEYDANGILIKQLDNDTSGVIWTVNAVNSHGLTTKMQYGNGYTVSNTYNTSTLSLEKIKHQRESDPAIVDVNYNYDVQRGILLSRDNLVFAKNETYQYDDLDRLLQESTNGIITQNYTFDKRGRMTSNTAVGKYNYNEQDYKLQDINFNANGSALNTSRGFVEVQYNAFKSPNEIFLAGKDRISYEYSILKTRSAAYYGSLNTSAAARPNRKYFSADKAIEIVKEGAITKIITYITGNPYSANYMKIDVVNGTTPISADNYYLHRDNQGSIVAITKADNAGTVIEKRYFDAWGNLKNANVAGTNYTPNALGWIPQLLIDRGYTGHEHLKTVGLIHMNGRLYDPVLRRFLSPDNYVQNPYNTQNYNRYGYVYNNPLLYTDPSGELAFLAVVAIGAAVAILTNGINNMINGIPFWYGMGKSGFMGAVSGAISFGIGSLATDTFGVVMTTGKAMFQAGMHAVSGGLMSELQGGTFGSGFAAGAISSLISSGIEGLGQTGEVAQNIKGENYAVPNKFGVSNLYKATMLAAGGLSGGISSSLAGGNFWAGVRQGVMTSGLNHLAHSVANGIEARQNLVERLKAAGIEDPSARASYEGLSLEEFALKVFPDMYNDSTSPCFAKVENLEEGANGEVPVQRMTYKGKTTYSINGPISIARKAFSSYLRLASTIGHELIHLNNVLNGSYSLWFQEHNSDDYVKAMSESASIQWEALNGGLPNYDLFIEYQNDVFQFNRK